MIRKIAVMTVAAFALLVAGAQAHNMMPQVSCGSVTLGWYSFNDGGHNNSLNGGVNTPTYNVAFTPAGSTTPIVQSGSVTFGIPYPVADYAYKLDYSKTLQLVPAVNGTVVVTSSWTAGQTTDGDADTNTFKVPITDCQPTLTTTALPSTIQLGGNAVDVAHLAGAANPTGTITWGLYGPNDDSCSSANPLVTASVPVHGDGDYQSPPLTPGAAGTYHWEALYSGDANNPQLGPVGCNDPNETLTVTSPPPPPPTPTPPAFTMRKLEAISNSNLPFTPGPITAQVGQQIDYEIAVVNTGGTPLDLGLVDTLCTDIAGPFGDVVHNTLAIGGTAIYTCHHVVVPGDVPMYVNVAQVTGTPPGGSPLPPQRSSVIANIPRSGVLACVVSRTVMHRRSSHHGKRLTLTVSDAAHGKDIAEVRFLLDGRTIKTLKRPNARNGRFRVTVSVNRHRYGRHRLTASVRMKCGPAQSHQASFLRKAPARHVVPHFTG